MVDEESADDEGADDDGSPDRDGADDRGAGGDESTADEAPAEPVLSPATKSSLLWGLVGGLSFLVLVQGYELVANPGIGFGVKLVVAVVVTVGATAVAHLTRPKLPTETESP